ncbi:hypothetical protein MUK70_10720 [Dyadobacter chenwenxiniae]|nr:hypothetical protein [Dyadobacter chenwenxiniae]UON85457.1 hypothetical protein MUK70_10720 [Dyadobacter chenwenxiniae]
MISSLLGEYLFNIARFPFGIDFQLDPIVRFLYINFWIIRIAGALEKASFGPGHFAVRPFNIHPLPWDCFLFEPGFSGQKVVFLQALLTGEVLPPSLALMHTYQDIYPETLPDELKYYKQYGLGLMKIETDHGTAVEHDGHVYEFVGKVFYLP